MWRFSRAPLCVVFTALVLGIVFIFPKHANATTGVNQELSFEGKIVTSAGINIPDGTYNMQFKIYSGCTAANPGPTNNAGCTSPTWTEDYLAHGSEGGTTTQGVSFSSGTFVVNLGSICAFTGGSCEGYTNTAINWNTYPLYLSMQIGNTSSSCTTFATCGGDGEMGPYILLTSTPYALNANELGGFSASSFAQLASNQTFTGTNTFQPTTNINGLTVLQTSAASPTADIFDVNTANSTSVIQVTGPSANNASVNIGAVGSSQQLNLGTNAVAQAITIGNTTGNTGVTINGGTGAIQIGTQGVQDAITIGNTTGNTSVTINGGTGAIQIGAQGIQDAITIGNTTGNTSVTINGGTGNINIGAQAVADAISIGNNQSGTSVGITGQGTVSTFSNTGLGIKTNNNSTTALQVTDSGNSIAFDVNTSNDSVGLGVNGTSTDKLKIQTGLVGATINETSTNNILQLQAGGANTVTVTNSGATTFENGSNSTTALQVQNVSGNDVLDTDTTNGHVSIGNSTVATPVQEWDNHNGSGSLASLTVAPHTIGNLMAVAVFVEGGGSGNPSGGVSGGGVTNWREVYDNVGHQNEEIWEGTVTSTGSTTLTIGYTGTVSESDVAAQEFTAGLGSSTIWSVNAFNGTDNSASTTLTYPTLTAAQSGSLYWGYGYSSASTTSPGSTPGFNYITTGFLDQVIYGNDLIGGTSYSPTGVNSSSATSDGVAMIISASVGSTLNVNGSQTITGVTSTSAFQVQNSIGLPLLTVNTASGNTNNLVANPSFESVISNWSAVGTGAAAQSSAQAYEGSDSLLITSGSTEGGASYSTGATSFLATSTAYTMSAFIKTDSSVPIHIDMGDSETGTLIPCLTNQLLPQNGGWLRFTCSWTTSGTAPTNSFIYFKQTSTDPAVTKNIYVDDVLLQTNANSQTIYNNGSISLSGTSISSQVILQNTANSSNAFQVNNAAGTQIFDVDTTDTNLISNPGFEVNTTGWSANANTTISRDTSNSYTGVAALKVTIAGATVGGTQFSLNPVVTAASTSYTISFSANLISGTAPTFQVTYSPDGTATSTCSPGAIVTGGWTRISCSGLTSATTPTTSGFIKIAQTNSAISTWDIDAVQLEIGSTATAYGAGNINLNGVIQSPVAIRGLANSTTAFQVQNASSINLLTVDTLGNNVNLGATGSTALASTVNIANSNSASNIQTVNIGNSADASNVVLIQGGTSATAIQLQTGNNTTATIGIGNNAVANTIQIGTTSTNTSNTQAINIGNLNAAGTTNITIGTGSSATGGTTTLQSKSTLALGNAISSSITEDTASSGTITIGGTNATTTIGRSGAALTLNGSNFSVGSTVTQIGSGTANTTGVNLELNNYDATLGTEPTEADGAMYYNSTINQFRCGVKGAWETCGGLDIANIATASCTVATSATSCVPNNYYTSAAPSIPANYCLNGRAIHVVATGIYTGTTAATTMTFSVRLAGTIIGAASPAITTGTVASMQWRVDFYITCDSTTTVTGEGIGYVFATAAGVANTGQMTGTGTTTVTNTSAQAIALDINVGATADVTSITMEQFIVQGL